MPPNHSFPTTEPRNVVGTIDCDRRHARLLFLNCKVCTEITPGENISMCKSLFQLSRCRVRHATVLTAIPLNPVWIQHCFRFDIPLPSSCAVVRRPCLFLTRTSKYAGNLGFGRVLRRRECPTSVCVRIVHHHLLSLFRHCCTYDLGCCVLQPCQHLNTD